MPPPPPPIMTAAQPADVWDEVNKFLNSCEPGPSPLGESLSPAFGSGNVTGHGGMTTPLSAESNSEALQELLQILGSPASPAPQQPLHLDPTSSSSLLPPSHSPAHGHLDFETAFRSPVSAPSSFGPSPDILVSPADPAPPCPNWGDSLIGDMPLFDDSNAYSPAGAQRPFPAAPEMCRPHASSQESTTSSSSGSNQPTTSPTTAPSVSSSQATKRPRLSPYPTTSHRRNVSASSASSAAQSPYLGASSRPTGYRRNVKATDLLSLDAPVQTRKYTGPSTTARKEVPASVARTYHPPMDRKRSSSQAGLAVRDDAQQGGAAVDSSSSEDRVPPSGGGGAVDGDDKSALAAHIEAKRLANTLAARRTRLRKAQHAEQMQQEIDRLIRDKEALEEEKAQWQRRAEQAESQLLAIQTSLSPQQVPWNNILNQY